MTLDLAKFGWDIAKVFGGALIAGAGAYFVLARDLSYIKGQLAQLIALMKLSEKNRDQIAMLKQRQDKTDRDMNGLGDKVRSLTSTTGVSNGPA